MNDLPLAWRNLRKNPGFTLVAVLTLALGVGANTAIFSVVKTVLLNPLPYRDPGHLVGIAETEPGTPDPVTVDFTSTQDWRTRSHSFESMSLYRNADAAFTDRGSAELLHGLRVSAGFFDTLGIPVQRGRTFLPEEDQPDRRHVAILSHALWVRRFAADPHILGRSLRLADGSFTVVGVLPPDFRLLFVDPSSYPEIFMPLGYSLQDPFACRGCQHLRLIARLKNGVSSGTARAELSTIMADLVREHPTSYDRGAGVRLETLENQIRGPVGKPLWILLGAVGFVLLIACANVASLVLARATGREKEFALRAALGAGRLRIARQLLAESLLLALLGGGAGVLLASWLTSALASSGPVEIPRVSEVTVDFPVLLFGLGASLITGLLFGLAPALRASRVELNTVLGETGRSTAGPARLALRDGLVAAELALAFLLVVGAGLLGKSFLRLMDVNPGYDPHRVLTLSTYVYGDRYKQPEAELGYYQQALDRLRAIPGIESVAMVSTLPLSGFDRRAFHVQDRKRSSYAEDPSVDAYSVSPDYFRVLRIPLKRGRLFTSQDRQGAPLTALISESCAGALFPHEDPLGRHIQLGGRHDDKPWATIVGIVGDVRQYSLDRPSDMEAYIPQAQDLTFSYNLVARTTIDPRRLENAARQAFLSVDKNLPVYDVQPLEKYLQATLARRTFTLVLLGLFGALALFLAAIGIYGLSSYVVNLRKREFGIRIALGATGQDVLKMVLRLAGLLVAIGIGAGFLASLALTRLLTGLLYQVRPLDPSTTLAAAFVIAAVALAGTCLPALRATRIDPMTALRYE